MIDDLIDVSQIDPHVAVFTNRMIPESMRYMSEVSVHYGSGYEFSSNNGLASVYQSRV